MIFVLNFLHQQLFFQKCEIAFEIRLFLIKLRKVFISQNEESFVLSVLVRAYKIG